MAYSLIYKTHTRLIKKLIKQNQSRNQLNKINHLSIFIVLILFEFVKTLNKMRHEPYPRHDLVDSVSKEIRAKSIGMLLPVEDEGKMI